MCSAVTLKEFGKKSSLYYTCSMFAFEIISKEKGNQATRIIFVSLTLSKNYCIINTESDHWINSHSKSVTEMPLLASN